MLSIITPTYNREKELTRVYNSLLNQTNKDFEWLVIDDGSKDKTKELINMFIKEKKINIKYIRKENGGKPSAYNLGVEKSRGNLIICLDSDDILRENAVATILKDFQKIEEEDLVAGIVYNCGYLSDKKIIGTNLPNNIIDSYYNIYEKYNVKGDKLQVIKSDIARQYSFPIIKGEKFIAEALINNRISLKYSFLYKNKILEYKEYLDDGYSKNYFNLVKKNPLGNCLYFLELYKLNNSWYNVYGYLLFSFYAKRKFKDIFKEHKARVKLLLLYLPTLVISKLK